MKAEESKRFIEHCRGLYRKTLLDGVVPFWERYGFDREHGGISNLLDDTGKALSFDKFIWSQGRALWTFSSLCQRIEPRAQWRTFADHIYRYLRNHGRDERGRWMFRLDEKGNVVERDISVYADAFALMGLTEYYGLSNNPDARTLALETYATTRELVLCQENCRIAPYTIPAGMKTLGIPMIYAPIYFRLGTLTDRPDIRQMAVNLALQVLDDFYRPEKNALLEFVSIDGIPRDIPESRICIPGHGIEALWFLISIFEVTGDMDAVQTCCSLVQRHLELAWDPEYGGLRLAIDIDGAAAPKWNSPDCKPWWVQVEALVATAYAYVHCREDWCLEWHRRIQEYAFRHYPVATGEWTQWLDRFGKKTATAALPVKDPFHLPRGLMYLIDLFVRRITV